MAVFTEEEMRLFDGYTNGTLTAAEKLQFEQKLSNQKEVNNRFTLYHTIVLQIQNEGAVEKKLKERFKKLDSKQKRKHWFSYIAIAASVVGVVLIITFKLTLQSNQIDIASYKVKEPGLPVIMGEQNESPWTSIMQLYKQKKFSEALSAIPKEPLTDTSLYFTGLMQEFLGEAAQAVNSYEQLQNVNKASIFKDKGEYRLAILLWEKGDKTVAKALLKTVADNPSHIYQTQAKKALQELSK